MENHMLAANNLILAAWKSFIATGEYDGADVRQEIARSWLRSFKVGVDPYKTVHYHSLAAQSLNKVRSAKRELIKVATPFMEKLYQFVKGTDFVVVLTDENGYILEMFGDEDALRNPIALDFFSGACWSEQVMGTNAIGTALLLGEPIQVSGAEHFCQKHHRLTCSSAPIFDATGQITAVLNMSGASDKSHLHTLGMVVAAADAVMGQLRIQQKNYELMLINNRLTNFFNAVSDGVIIVDKGEVVVELNPAAQNMLGKADKVVGIPVKQLFEYRTSVKHKVLSIHESYNEVEIMVCMKNGLCNCLVSGMPILQEQGAIIGGIIIIRPIKQVQNLIQRLSGYSASLQFSDIIGESLEIREAVRLATLSATNASNILLQGESGTGKEIFAQAIHNLSPQYTGPFIALNCGAIPRELIGSELFGYEEGAFTGARRGGKPGKFELASGGTLFLDEIGDMPLEQQTALLRVIQEKKVTRIGGDKMLPVQVRLICASNKNLVEEVAKGTFRQDLFYRLNVIAITIPPLRQRKQDISLLFNHFLEKLGTDWGRKFSAQPLVIEYLAEYSWPGNVRELQNVVERAASLAENGNITVKHLPAEICPPNFSAAVHSEVVPSFQCREQRQKFAKGLEKDRILSLLNQYAGNVSKVARELGISRKTLYNKMHAYAIEN
ncbi:MAG: sigma-54-dependent Fis family transcriptional regulator [Pelosinus sp.]|nr:sigma-54-dependent Fis family transcriptional regulator [Pelosinus sp.]